MQQLTLIKCNPQFKKVRSGKNFVYSLDNEGKNCFKATPAGRHGKLCLLKIGKNDYRFLRTECNQISLSNARGFIKNVKVIYETVTNNIYEKTDLIINELSNYAQLSIDKIEKRITLRNIDERLLLNTTKKYVNTEVEHYEKA